MPFERNHRPSLYSVELRTGRWEEMVDLVPLGAGIAGAGTGGRRRLCLDRGWRNAAGDHFATDERRAEPAMEPGF